MDQLGESIRKLILAGDSLPPFGLDTDAQVWDHRDRTGRDEAWLSKKRRAAIHGKCLFDFAAKAEQKLGNRPAYQRQAIGDHSYHPDKSLRGEYSQKKKQMLCLCLPGLLVLGRATARTDFPADKDPVPISRVSYCPPSCLFSASSEAAMTVRQTIDFDMLLFGRLEQNFLPAPTLARRLFFASS